jgi:hypothetical protein
MSVASFLAVLYAIVKYKRGHLFVHGNPSLPSNCHYSSSASASVSGIGGCIITLVHRRRWLKTPFDGWPMSEGRSRKRGGDGINRK